MKLPRYLNFRVHSTDLVILKVRLVPKRDPLTTCRIVEGDWDPLDELLNPLDSVFLAHQTELLIEESFES